LRVVSPTGKVCRERDEADAVEGGCVTVHRSRLATLLVVLLVLLGIGARVFQFWRNDSLMLDECAVCLNVANRDLGGFTRRLGYDQAAPLGFLILQKAVFATVGMDDITTRVVPLIFGLLTIVLIVLLSRRLFDIKSNPCATILAIGLIALNRGIIGYSATAKQYSLECAITLLLLLALAECIGEGDSRGSPASRMLLVLSPALLWFSYGAVFIIGGMGAALVGRAVFLKRSEAWKLAIYFGLAAFLMLVPFYLLSMHAASANRALAADWARSYLPLWPPEATVLWLYHHFVSVGEMLIHLRLAFCVPLALFAVAIQAVYSRSWFWIAGVASILLSLIASALHYYPFEGRLLLFLMPVFALITADAVKLVERRSRLAAAFITGTLLVAATAALSLHGMFRHRPVDNVRKVHEEMVSRMAPGDQLWVSSLATPCFLYYIRQYPLPHDVSVHLIQPGEQPVLPSGRDWVLVMRTPWEPGEGEALLAAGAARGKEESSFDVEWTTARLFTVRGTRTDQIAH
jgi:hypothetical protein